MSSLKTGFSLLRIRTLDALQYRMSALSGASVGILWGLIEITVFIVFYKYADNRSAAMALSLKQTVTYTWLSEAFLRMLTLGQDNDLYAKITNGDVGVELCRPLDLYTYWFFQTAAGKIGSTWWIAIITVVVGIILPGNYHMSGPASPLFFLLFCISLLSAFLLCNAFVMLMTAVEIGVAWGAGPSNMILHAAAVYSGTYLPLQLWPNFMQKFLYIQPFAGCSDLPLRLFVGSTRLSEAAATIGLQLGWTALFIIAGRLIMRHKLKNIVVQGG
jgi:ABC-2 type transport system permease protein